METKLEPFVWFCDSCAERRPVKYHLPTDNYHCDSCAEESTPDQQSWDNAVNELLNALAQLEQLLSFQTLDNGAYEEADELRKSVLRFVKGRRP